MNPSQWTQIRAPFEQALLLPPAARPAFLDANCNADGALRAAAETLIAADQRMLTSGLEQSLIAKMAK